jgi:hypothetical protein
MPRPANPPSDRQRRALMQGPLVLTPAAAARRWPLMAAVAAAAALAGVVATQLFWQQRIGQAQRQAVALAELQQLRLDLERATLTQRVSSARGDELERQVEALNQRLRERDEELAFFRKTRSGSR